MNVQYDWDVAGGGGSLVYARAHLLTAPGALAAAVVATFGVLWVYAPHVAVLRDFKVFAPVLVFFSLLLVAQITLSSRIVRVLAMAYPMFLLVPMMLYRLQFRETRTAGSR